MDLTLIARDDVFPLSRARAVGIDQAELRALQRDGWCHRLHHGWFATRVPVDEEDHHRLRMAALLQQYAGGAVASDASALLLLGLPTYAPDWQVAYLMRTKVGRKAHAKADLLVRPALEHRDGALLPATSRTVHPAVAVALAGLADPCSFLAPADAALSRGLLSVDDLHLAVEMIGRRPGIGRVRAALPFCDARHESVGESVTAWVLRQLGYRVVPQYAVPDTGAWTPAGRGFRADFGIVGTRVLVEFDGRSKYRSERDLWQEKQREDRIRSLGWEVVRLTWADLHRPERVRALVEAARLRSERARRPA